MKTLRTLLAGSVASAALAMALASPASAADTAQVSILHGVPGATVDVYANGNEVLKDFTPGTLTDPLSLPAGTYDLKVTAPGAGAGAAAVIEAKGVTVPAGANITVVAHLNASGTPVLTPYVNDVSPVAAGKARLTVRHDAAAPDVDVRGNGAVAFPNLTNPGEVKADLAAGTITADVVLSGTSTVAIGPADLTLKEGTNTIVYAWGSAQDGKLQLAVQTIGGLHSDPAGVPSGTAGLVDDGSTQRLLLAGAAALAAAGFSVLVIRRRAAVRV